MAMGPNFALYDTIAMFKTSNKSVREDIQAPVGHGPCPLHVIGVKQGLRK